MMAKHACMVQFGKGSSMELKKLCDFAQFSKRISIRIQRLRQRQGYDGVCLWLTSQLFSEFESTYGLRFEFANVATNVNIRNE